MPYGVTMFIDQESEDAIWTVWEILRDAGLSSFMLDNKVRPHITIAIYDELDVEAFHAEFIDFIKELSPIGFALSSIGTFIEPSGTLFLGPTVTHRLMNVHSRFHTRFETLEHSLNEFSLPGRWFPHFTLASGLNVSSMAKAVEIVLNADLPVQSRIEEIGIGEINFQEDSRRYMVSWLHTYSLVNKGTGASE